MVYRKEEEKDCVQYSGEEYRNFKTDRYGVHVEYCDNEDEEDEE